MMNSLERIAELTNAFRRVGKDTLKEPKPLAQELAYNAAQLAHALDLWRKHVPKADREAHKLCDAAVEALRALEEHFKKRWER